MNSLFKGLALAMGIMGASGLSSSDAGDDASSAEDICIIFTSGSSTLAFILSSKDCAGVGEGGEEGVFSRLSAFLRLIVTLLDTGSAAGSERAGVLGGSCSGESTLMMLESGGCFSSPGDGMVSTDELLEPEREVLRRFRPPEDQHIPVFSCGRPRARRAIP